ncbi:MAG TPA: ATP-binding protein [Solirubrobacteraceae bacterium]|nr:ATP-binding protein [Solirubrobacteraceae bacterium]
MATNPFKPSFGVSPPVLVGRDALIDEFVEGLEDGPGSTARATIYTGARGAGKTVMLNAVEDRARALGWLVVSETASPGFVDRIARQQLPRLLQNFDPKALQRRVTGITGPLGSGAVSWSTADRHAPEATLRSQIELATDLLAEHETGLLITLDEIHHNQIAELRQVATTVQHAFREERQLAFVGAGLASAITDVVNDEVLTFLRRAERHALGSVAREDVARAIRAPLEVGGRTVAGDVLDVMVDGTRGYPFLIQLVGAQVWRRHRSDPEISMDSAREGVSEALRRLGRLVYEPALADASAIDKSFLLAMAKDDGPSRMKDIQQRLEIDANYASQYRLRLIASELIESTSHGYVDFALPYLRDYLREHAAAAGLSLNPLC